MATTVEHTTPRARMRVGSGASSRTRLVDAALGILGLALIVGFWWLLSTQLQPIQLPAPDVVWHAAVDNLWDMPALNYATYQSGGIVDGLVYTAQNVFLGVGIGLVLGSALGLTMGRSRFTGTLLDPPMVLLGTVPVLIVLPFIVTWFGTARLAQTGLVIFFSFVAVAAVVRNAVVSVAGSYEHSARALGASRSTVLRHVVLPAITPELVAVIRVCLAAAWGFEAIAEILGAQHGVGRIIQAMGTQSATPELMATVICLAILAVFVDALVVVIAKTTMRWTD